MSDTGPVTGDAMAQNALLNLCLANPFFKERYKGWEELGQGAFATVIKAHCVDRGAPVALKIFRHGGDDEDRRRLHAEVQNAQRVVSPLLVRTYSPFDQGGLRWIEMEFVEGTTLEDELRRREQAGEPFTPAEALEIGHCIASALALAHRERVIHRDLKPANILLPRSREPLAKLADFGISRFAGAEKLTGTGAFPGTPKFGSPEAFAGEPLGPPHDVYSLGLCLYLLFTNNRFPFPLPSDYSLQTLVSVHTRRAPIPARSFTPGLNPRLDGLLTRCLEKRPGKRPSAEDVLAELEAVRTMPAPSASERIATRNRRIRVVAAGIGLAALAALLWNAAVRGTQGDAARAPLSRERVLQDPGTAATSRPAMLEARLNGPFLEIRNGAQAVGQLSVELRAADGRVSTSKLPHELAAGETSFIPLQELRPPAKPGTSFTEIRVAGQSPAGPFRISVPTH